MGRAPCCDKANVKKGPWSPEEDEKLKAYIEQNGTGGNWIALPQKIGLKRCGKSCRLRWLNYLRPNIKHGGFSEEEDNIICSLYISIGSRWSVIAAQLPGRTDNDIKNYWNTRLKKKLLGRRKQSHRNRFAANQDRKDASCCDEDGPPAISSSALERLQLHMQLQSLQSPLSLYNHPALWPGTKLLPLPVEKMVQDLHFLNHAKESGLNPLNPTASAYVSRLPGPAAVGLLQQEANELQSSLKGMSSSPEDGSTGLASKECIDPHDSASAVVPDTNCVPRSTGCNIPTGSALDPVSSFQSSSQLEEFLSQGLELLTQDEEVEDQLDGFDFYSKVSETGSKKEVDSFSAWISELESLKFSSSGSWDAVNCALDQPEMFEDYVGL